MNWKSALCLLGFCLSHIAEASTFIGNGGNTADLQLQVTLATIHRTADDLDTDTNVLCRCPAEWTSGEMCESLRSLSKEEVLFCQKTLTNQAQALAEISAKSSPVVFRWSSEEIATSEVGGKVRDVDALVVSGKGQIVIQRDRFMSMTASQRVALLTHELFHILPIEGRQINDSEKVGPFQKGMLLLDALGAAMVIESVETGVKDELRGLENISRSNKKWWIFLDWKALNSPEKSTNERLRDQKSNATTLGFEYRYQMIGLRLLFDDTRYSAARSSILVKETTYSSGAGLSFSGTPFDLYLSRWSEVQLTGMIGAMFGTSEYEATDSATLLSDSSSLRTYLGQVQLMVPIYMGFWVNVGGEVRQVNAKYEKLNIRIDERQSAFSFGGSYGF